MRRVHTRFQKKALLKRDNSGHMVLWHAEEVKLPEISPPEGTDRTALSLSLCCWILLRCVKPP